LKPESAAARQWTRLRDLVEPQQIAVKTARTIFLTPRHRNLHMIQPNYAHHKPHLRRDLRSPGRR
jgi:hypothetical protein